MEPVKIASSLGGHGPQLLYPGGRQPPPAHPPGTQVIHPPTTRTHEGSPYKGTISPPMVSRGAPYSAYAPVDGGGGPRYIQQPYISYSRESPYTRPMTDRPVILQPPRRPTMIGPYSGYRGDMMQIIPTSMQMNPNVDSCKRIKLTPTVKSDVRYPLVIDTDTNHTSRDPPYYPQVEAISPTLPLDPRDESPLHSNTQDLIHQLDFIDKEISMMDSKVSTLTKKEKELQAAAQKGDTSLQQEEDDAKEQKHRSTVQVIYAENRKRAEESHTTLYKLIPDADLSRVLPLYHQPTDTEVYHNNNKKYHSFKQHLLEYFKRKQDARANRDQQVTQTYSKLMSDWLRKVDKIENSKKNKEKVGKNRELFEKVFPELRKQREDKERFSRVGTRVKSEADMEEIMDGLQEQENEDKKMRAYTVIPPILIDGKRRKHRYINQNGLIEEPVAEYKDHKNINIWTEQESEIFREKYLLHPKNFVVVASYLERKSVRDCIQFYYLNKKKENYKLLVKRRMRRPRANKTNNQNAMEPLTLTNSTGVTTRGSAAAAQKGIHKSTPSASSILGCSASRSSSPGISYAVDEQQHQQPPITMNGTACAVCSGATSSTTATTTSSTMNWVQISSTNGTQPGTLVDSVVTVVDSSVSKDGEVVSVSTSAATSTTTSSTTSTSTAITTSNINTTFSVSSSEVREKDKENLLVMSDKLARRDWVRKDDDKTKEDADSSDEENLAEHGRGGPHECVVCQTKMEHYGLSRPVAPGQASQYSLNESGLPPNARVCAGCRCRAVRRKVPQCPIPTCTTPKWKVKRLRPFPSKWNLIPTSLKEPIIKELQIPSDVAKSCSACHTRMMRKLGSEAEEPFDVSRWSEEDVENLKRVLREVGCHWSRVSERLANKSASQCRSFYNNLKGKYNLDEAVTEYRKSKGKTDPPTVTDEEESGSSTSSCDETVAPPPPTHPPPHIRHDSASDTASATSPLPASTVNEEPKDSETREAVIKEPKPPPGAVIHPTAGTSKEEYDSSTTASADEGQSGVGRDSPPEVEHIPHPGEKRQALSSHSKPVPQRVNPNTNRFDAMIHENVEEALGKYDHTSTVGSGKSILDIENINMQTIMEHTPFSKNYSKGSWNYGPGFQMSNPTTSIPDRSHRSEECEGGLDLTVKKRERSSPPHLTGASQIPPSSNAISQRGDNASSSVRGNAEPVHTGGSPPKAHSNCISYSNNPLLESNRYMQPEFTKSPSMFIGDSRAITSTTTAPTANVSQVSSHVIYGNPPRQVTMPKVTKSNMAPPPPISINSQRLSQIPTNQSSVGGRLTPKHEKPQSLGSIIHGTPVNQATHGAISLSQPTRLEMITKPVLTREGGSITQGTPVHHEMKRSVAAPPSNLPNKECVLEQRGERNAVEIIPTPTHVYDRESSFRATRPPPMGSGSTITYPFSNYHYSNRPPYSDSQTSTRQITEDFLTAKQMPLRRGTPGEKDIRVSPLGRDPSPHGNPRDHRNFPPHHPHHAPPPPPAAVDRRNLEPPPRVIESRAIDHRVDHRLEPVVEFRPIDVRPVDEKLRKVQFVRTSHGIVPIPSQPSGQHYFTPADRGSRSSASPASVRDATPTPPSDALQHDFRSPGISTPTPPPRHNSVIQRRLPSKSSVSNLSPHPEQDRYSPLPRHSASMPAGSSEALHSRDNGSAMQRSIGYANIDLRREIRPNYVSSVSAHEVMQNEHLGKKVDHIIDPAVHGSNRYNMHEMRQGDRDKEVHPIEIRTHPDDKRFHEIVDYRSSIKEDFRRMNASGKLKKFSDEGEHGKIIVNYPIDASNPQSPKTAADYIQAIIAGQLKIPIDDPSNRDIRVCRRESEPPPAHSLSISEADKRVHSPASISFLHKKDKEVVTLEDGPDPNAPHRQIFKDSHHSSLHPSFAHHANLSKQNQVHIDILSREYSNESKKISSSNHHPHSLSQPPLEITRTDGRAISLLNHYEQSKARSSVPSQIYPGEKDITKDRFDSRSPHRMQSSASTNHIHSNPHLATGERQIIRIAQNPNHGSDCLDIIKNRLLEIYREDDSEISDKRSQDVQPRLSRSGTPIGQQQQQRQATPHHSPQTHHSPMSQQQQHPSHHPHPPLQRNNPHYDDEHVKKRPRLDLPESSQRPTRPRSNGPESKEQLSREEVADSPQSGEMVIDESPRDAQSMMKLPCDMSGRSAGINQALAADGMDKGVDRQPRHAPIQYSNSYQGYRMHSSGSANMPPHSGSWGGVNAPPPPITSSSNRFQGYEPNVEPVSDDD